jgi:Bacterial Ig-like domain (group 1)
MRLSELFGLLVPLTAVATLACGGDDLVLPTGETPSSRRPAALEIYSGNGLVGTSGMALEQPVIVQVVDQEGAGLAGQTVSWSVATGEGSITPTSVTDSEGLAAATWTLGNPGPNTSTATVAGLGSVTFIATANNSGNGGGGTAGEPHHFVFRVQPHDVREDEWFTVEVAITDAYGNVVPLNGTEIYLGLWETGDDHPTNGRLAGDRFEDTVNGVATFRLYVNEEGTYRLNARSDYLPKHLGPYGPELFSNSFEVD